ncbi:beta-galactosidase [Thermogemmatispora carboxidivorans]|uniref:beta-galactosidase n=1 Tax=Thermogemmatispora carboxidivorans TaxID=1382306 RepID=UPI000AF038F7|nr:beta-galactosidase [Thermogemmatispora carboxidivorans]
MSATSLQPHLPADDRSYYRLDLRAAEEAEGGLPEPRLLARSPQGETLALTPSYLLRNGQPWIPIMGEFHPSRYPRRYWREALQKMRAGGLTLVSIYVFWIHVEEEEGRFDWSENRDLRAFVQLCGEIGLEILLRVGPFVHGECRNGGLPDWLYGRAVAVRSNDERYLFYVRRYFAEIARQVRGFFFQDGGPILGVQLENEYMHAGAPWELTFRPGSEWVPRGDDGPAHLERLRVLANEVGLVAPLYTCTAWGGAAVPAEGFLPMHAAYPFTPWEPDPAFEPSPSREFLFRSPQQPENEWWQAGAFRYPVDRYPYVYCELGSGIQMTYLHRPQVPPECTQALAVVALGSGCNWLGYYMYHGGSNPVGRHGFFNEFTVPRLSYDFQAPLGEYGQLHPSYHHLRLLHLFLEEFGSQLAPLPVVLPPGAAAVKPQMTGVLRYAARAQQGQGFLFVNTYQDHAGGQDLEGISLELLLPEGRLRVPRAGGLTLRRGLSAILPVGLELGSGLRLRYATAQPLTVLRTAGRTRMVFFAPEGLQTEFALAREGCRTLTLQGGRIVEEQETLYAWPEPGLGTHLEMTSMAGETVELLVLSQEQALRCWKVPLAGDEYLLLTGSKDAAWVDADEEGLRICWQGEPQLEVLSYPPLPASMVISGSLEESGQQGLFWRYRLQCAPWAARWSLEQPEPQVVRLRLAAEALEGVHDLFLQVDCVADVGQAFLDGQLVADYFGSDQPWVIGLKRFLQPGQELELILRFTPLRADAPVLRYFSRERLPAPASDGTLPVTLRAIRLVPEYSVQLEQHC